MNISSTTTATSKLYPDVTFTFRKFSEKRHQDFSLATSEAKYRLRDLLAELDTLKLPEGVEPDQVQTAKLGNLHDQINSLIDREFSPAWITHYLKSVDGLTIDDQPCTIELFLTDAPSDLYRECVSVIQKQAELLVEEKNA